jgi:hypothetical protein
VERLRKPVALRIIQILYALIALTLLPAAAVGVWWLPQIATEDGERFPGFVFLFVSIIPFVLLATTAWGIGLRTATVSRWASGVIDLVLILFLWLTLSRWEGAVANYVWLLLGGVGVFGIYAVWIAKGSDAYYNGDG